MSWSMGLRRWFFQGSRSRNVPGNVALKVNGLGFRERCDFRSYELHLELKKFFGKAILNRMALVDICGKYVTVTESHV